MNLKKLLLPAALLLMFVLLATMTAGIVSSAAGSAPVAENLSLETYRGVSVGGRLNATDPDGDALTFEVATPPAKGELDLSSDGRFVYTPAEGKRGKDYFGFRAVDPDGNRSQEGTVIIKIQKQKSPVAYSDTAGTQSAYAAQRLAEEGVFTGECVGGVYVFSPDKAVTRQEFLTMCMCVTGAQALTAAGRTGFADDGDIAAWARPYVGAALRSGVVSGVPEAESGVVFDPERGITVLEAAVMLDRAARLTDAALTWYEYAGSVPAWAMQSAVNISSCGLLPEGVSFSDPTLSRGDAACMLSAAMDLLARR